MTGANKLTEDLEFIYPGTAYIGHDYDEPERPWPITADGRNLSIFREHNDSDPGSFFIHGKLEDFAGCYWRNSDFGFGHWAIYEDLPGQKFFRWRLSRAGAIWEDLLTDTDGQYYEPQMGRLLDQNDHEFFAPYSTDQWKEAWFPYHGIGPMSAATPFGVLNVENQEDQILLRFFALQEVDEELVVELAGQEVLREHIALGPGEFHRSQVRPRQGGGELRVSLGDKLSYTNDPEATKLSRPLNFRNYSEGTVEGIYQSAEREEKARNYDLALEKYLDCLEQEPLHLRALTRVAELYCRRAEYDKALQYANKALDYVMYDPDANYIYGVISRRMGNTIDAKETLGWAARSMKYRSNAYCQLAEIYLMEKNWKRVFEYLQRSLDYNVYNIQSYQVLSTSYRLNGESKKAEEILEKILDLDPLHHLSRFERYLLNPTPEGLNQFRSHIRNELPHETYLELAMYYVNLGLEEDALRLLEVTPEYPTSLYWQAYLLRERSPAKSRQILQKASALSPYLVFPYREESLQVFQWADEQLPENWKPKYFLGLIYWGLRRSEEARQAFIDNGNRPDYAPFYVCRAFLSEESDPEGALADYKRAQAVDSSDWRNWLHLATFYADQERHSEALSLAVDASRRFPDEDLIKILLARSYLNSGQYRDCFSVLENATILPFEGQRDVHSLFVQCQICVALEEMKQGRYEEALKWLEGSKEYPERLGSGRPEHPDYRVQDYLMMLCYENSGMLTEAEQALRRVQDYTTVRVRENNEVVQRKVKLWQSNDLQGRPELEALQTLYDLIAGDRRRRH